MSQSVAAGARQTITVPPYHTVAVTADVLSSGAVYHLSGIPGQQLGAVAPSGSLLIGPYADPRQFIVATATGALVYGDPVAVDFPAPFEAATAAQGAKADTALQAADVGSAAFTSSVDYAPAGITTNVVVSGVGTLHFTNGALTSVT